MDYFSGMVRQTEPHFLTQKNVYSAGIKFLRCSDYEFTGSIKYI